MSSANPPKNAETQLTARLISHTGDVYQFAMSSISLGRDESNQIVLNSRKASRQHALIFFQKGYFYIRDLSSKNGTWLNGERLEADRLLQSGDRLRIGELEFSFVIPDLGDATETASSFTGAKPTLEAVPLYIDFEAMQVWLKGQLLTPPLSPLEWKLLTLLYQRSGKVCTRDQIFAELYNTTDLNDIPLDTALETLVSRLRKRLEMTDPNQLPYIRAVRGAGYRLEF